MCDTTALLMNMEIYIHIGIQNFWIQPKTAMKINEMDSNREEN